GARIGGYRPAGGIPPPCRMVLRGWFAPKEAPFAPNLCLRGARTCPVMAPSRSCEYCEALQIGHSGLAISLAGRGLRAKKWINDDGGRPLTESPRHLPQSCPQEQNPTHHLPGERGEATRRGDLVR